MRFSIVRKAAVITLLAAGLLLFSNVAAEATPAPALAQVQQTAFAVADGGPAGWLAAIWQWATSSTTPVPEPPPPDGGGGGANPNGGGGGADGGGGEGPGIDPDGSKDP